MPDLYTPGGSQGGGSSSGFGGFKLPTATGNAAPPAQPSTAVGGNNLGGPGSVDVNLTDPAATAAAAAQTGTDLFSGLKQFLFGTNAPDAQGHHGGLPLIGDTPIGDAARFGSEVVANVAGQFGGLTDVAGGLAERIPVGSSEAIRQQYEAMPDGPEKQAAQAAMQKEGGQGGLLGTAIGSDFDHIMAKAISDYKTNNDTTLKPDVWNGVFKPAASLADEVGNLFGLLSAAQRVTERQIVGMGTRLDDIMAVGGGYGMFNGTVTGAKYEDGTGLTAVEQTVYDNLNSGRWDRNQAMDYLAGHGAGESHNPIAEIAGNIVLDPLNLATMGAGAVAAVGKAGLAASKLLEASQEGVKLAEAALEAAKAGEGAQTVEEATKALEAAQKGLAINSAGVKVAGTSRALNVVGKLKETQAVGDFARAAGGAYESIGKTSVGQVAKIVRTIIDPMHVMGGGPRSVAALEQGSSDVSEAMVHAAGRTSWDGILGDSLGLEGNGQHVVDQLSQGLGIAAANTLRRVVSRGYRAAQMGGAFTSAMLEEKGSLMKGITAAMKVVNKDALVQVEEEAGKYVHDIWSDSERMNLATRLSQTLKDGRSAEDWLAIIGKTDKTAGAWNGKRLSLLHQATYGLGLKHLHEMKAAAMAAGGLTPKWAALLENSVLLNRRTLTTFGMDGLRKALTNAVDDPERLRIITEYQQQYPELARFIADGTSASNTVERFNDLLDRLTPGLPHQITNVERADPTIPEALKAFDEGISESFTIGFKPEERYLWGLEPGLDGAMHIVGDPWFDQVSDHIESYVPIHQFAYNLAGKPLAVKAVGAAARLIDAAQGAAETIGHGVTTTMVSQMAKGRFTEQTLAKYAGVSEGEMTAVWQAMHKALTDAENVSGLRGFSEKSLWKSAEGVITAPMRRAGMSPRSLMNDIFDAYNGDTRYIGLTQKLSGKAKQWAFQATGSNVMGEIAEHAWPLLKFKLNPFFQLQEKFEPWILGAQRGVHIALGTTWNETDHLTAEAFRNWAEKSMVNLSDTDIAEMSRKFGWGKEMDAAAQKGTGAIAFFRSKVDGLTDVQGVKQINMMRTWQKGLGKEMRAVWEKTMAPGEFDKMLLHERSLAGNISEDEFAVRMAASNAAANSVIVKRITSGKGVLQGWQSEFENAIKEGYWTEPDSLGQMKALELDRLFKRMAIPEPGTGEPLDSLEKVKQALAKGTITNDDIAQELRALSAHEDYSARVFSALRFNYKDWWDGAQRTFGISDDMRFRLENFYRGAAEQRGMTPLEYMSQIYAPQLATSAGGVESYGSLGRLIAAADSATGKRQGLATLAGEAGVSTPEDLYKQMASIMTYHLDPSAKRAFLAQMAEDGRLTTATGLLNLDRTQDIEDLWRSNGEGAFADELLGFFEGRPGTGPHATLDVADATGNKDARDLASTILRDAGREPPTGRYIMEDAPELAQRYAKEYNGLEDWYTHVPTPEELDQRILPADLAAVAKGHTADLKAGYTDGMTPMQRASVQQYAEESRALYRRMTAPKAVGGGGIKVRLTRGAEPYKNADALRNDLAHGVLKIRGKGYWHPVMTDADAAITHAVQQFFGYGPEAVEFGSHHGVMSAARMYTDEARPTMLTDTLGRQAWETAGDQRVPESVLRPETMPEAEATWGRSLPAPDKTQWGDPTVTVPITRRFGPGFVALSPDGQKQFLGAYSDVRNHVNVPIGAVDIQPLPAAHGGGQVNAWTLPWGTNEPGIVFHPDAGFGAADDLEYASTLDNRQFGNDLMRKQTTVWEKTKNPATGVEVDTQVPRRSLAGRPWTVSSDPVGDMYHEFGHAVDYYLQQLGRAEGKTVYPGTLHDLLSDFYKRGPSGGRYYLSEYAASKGDGTAFGENAEAFAELFDLAINPAHAGEKYPKELDRFVTGLRKELQDRGIYSPEGFGMDNPARVANPYGGQLVRDVNAANPGAIQAPWRFGAMSDGLVADTTKHFLGDGRFASDPQTARIAAYTRDEMQRMVQEVIEHPENSEFKHFLDHTSGMPAIDGKPFNYAEATMRYAAQQSMVAKWQDAFRLQYFAQNRSMFQRSINHPMFGMYPASYMWGKVAPELIRFIAKEPFGIHTDAMALGLADLQKSVAMQRQFNPDFQKTIDDIGNSSALSFLGYLLPATPWDVPSSAPSWMRDMAQQGLRNNAAQANGANVGGDNFVTPLTQSMKRLQPLSSYTPWSAKAIAQTQDFLGGLVGGGQTGGLLQTEGQPTTPQQVQAPSQEPNLSQSTPAAGLDPILQQQMTELRSLLHP